MLLHHGSQTTARIVVVLALREDILMFAWPMT
jgi:hypothetical protein